MLLQIGRQTCMKSFATTAPSFTNNVATSVKFPVTRFLPSSSILSGRDIKSEACYSFSTMSTSTLTCHRVSENKKNHNYRIPLHATSSSLLSSSYSTLVMNDNSFVGNKNEKDQKDSTKKNWYHGTIANRADENTSSTPNMSTTTTTTTATTNNVIITRVKPTLTSRARRILSMRKVNRSKALAPKKFYPKPFDPTILPSIEIAKNMPFSIHGIDNTSLVIMGAMGNQAARIEILKRHIMAVDMVTYEVATTKFNEIADRNDDYIFLFSLPYKIGICIAITTGVISLPMVFDLALAQWFNTNYVSADIPEPKDMETVLEIGSWTWNWMEPVLGTISFVLLTLQFSRAQLGNLGYKPYTGLLKKYRANRLITLYPQYDPVILKNFSKLSHFVPRD